ncbi:MAG: cysteine desulfurase family protein [Bacilli bacterium]|nr:cysteine desulfurase family protein [Bacilli bacterium]
MIYLDYAAATPTEEEVLDTFYTATKKYYANPNSSHALGLEAKEMIDTCTKDIADYLQILPEEIIYTSGASESNNLAVKGICERYRSRGKHILISGLEHNSIVAPAVAMQELGFEVELIPINKEGYIDLDALKQMIREDTILVSVSAVDSELGIKQPIEEIGAFLKQYPNCFFHTDASQAMGKVNIEYKQADLITITPHKFYGMNGFGLLIKKNNVSLKPQINGGKSTTIYRSGTPFLAGIASCEKAFALALPKVEERYIYVKKLSDKIKDRIREYKNVSINNTDNSIPHTINLSMKGIKAIHLQQEFEKHGILVSTKTSCCPIETPSKLVYALTKDKGISHSSLRVSLSHLTKEEEVDAFLNTFDFIYKEYQNNGKI